MTINTVIKRDGSVAPEDTQKIKAVISWASAGLNVNKLELESKIEGILFDGVTTADIHENIIFHAQALASAETPDWVIVAGRLNSMKLWKETGAYTRGFRGHIRHMTEKGRYTHPLLMTYSDDEVEELSNSIVQERDLDHSYGSTLTANKKYLLEDEVIQFMFMVEAMIIFGARYKGEARMQRVKAFYNAASLRKVSLATPWLSNLRSNGNISSCFIISMQDDIESITDAWGKAARISKMGGGLGIYLGYLRAKGSSIAGRPNSAKSVSLGAKILNDIAVYIDQGGKRAGAFTPALPVWHNDVEDFLEIQSEVGDLRSKAYDIFPQVTTPNLFWEMAKSNGMWYTFCPKEAKELGLELNECWGESFNEKYHTLVAKAEAGELEVWSKRPAKDLVKKIMRTQFETGLPYITYVDKLNEDNPNKHAGWIACFNLCTESTSVFNHDEYSHTCNLASIVLGRCKDYAEIQSMAELLTEVLDAGIELTSPPTPCSARHNNDFRTIGVGIQGYHDWLAKEWKTYYDKEEATRVAEYIQYGCVKKSVELASELGAYPKFEGSEWDNGNMIRKFSSRSVAGLDWEGMGQAIKLVGIRNSQMTSPAPNTSTSVFMDAAAGISPVYSAFFREDNDNGKYPISCMHLAENPQSYSQSFRVYDQAKLAETTGAMQLFVDAGISAEALFDQNKEGFTAEWLYRLMITAYESGCKAVYYIRTIKKGESINDLLSIKEEGCAGCTG